MLFEHSREKFVKYSTHWGTVLCTLSTRLGFFALSKRLIQNYFVWTLMHYVLALYSTFFLRTYSRRLLLLYKNRKKYLHIHKGANLGHFDLGKRFFFTNVN
jgi:hypothetical protein